MRNDTDGHGHTRTPTLEGWRIAPAGEGAEGIGRLGFGFWNLVLVWNLGFVIWTFQADILGSLHRLESLCHQVAVSWAGRPATRGNPKHQGPN